ncbi:Outer membrane protein [Magnetospirillum sp. SS-4]|nr:Outer membrane protein [Magnetospirillum sp. SS-4]
MALTALVPAACSMTPEYQRPQQPLPASFRNQVPEPSPELPRPLSQWWKGFGSEELNALIEEALDKNHDIKAATFRIAQAEAQAGSAAAALLPTISVSGKRSVDAPTGGQGAILAAGTNRTHRLSSMSLSASYELDIWGKIRASEASALATALANVHDREALAITLVADLVGTYLQYLEFMDREAVALRNIANMKTMHAAVRERVRLGESSHLELAQQRNVLAQGEASVPPLVLQRERAFNRLATLLGRPPGMLRLSGNSLEGLKVPEVSPGLPTDLLLRRPDIKKAEANLVAANANIGVARAKMLPSLTLTGERGWASQLFDNITSPGSIFFVAAASVAGTIFDYGKTQSDIEYSRAKHSELVEVYQQTVLASLRDVEDALAAIRLQGELEVAQREVLLASEDAYRLSSEAFRLGMVDYLNVLETQRTRFQADDANVQAKSGRLAAVLSLYKALGGGMERPEDRAEEQKTSEQKPEGKKPSEQKPDTAAVAPRNALIPVSAPVAEAPEPVSASVATLTTISTASDMPVFIPLPPKAKSRELPALSFTNAD